MDTITNQSQKDSLPEVAIHPLEGNNKGTETKKLLLKTTVIAFIVALGVGTGYFTSKRNSGSGIKSSTGNPVVVKSEKIVGSTDTKTFRDQVEGVLEKGGIDGEGTHKLVRDKKRPDQNVYLTSSVVDLNNYVGKKVRVWGETFTGQKAGWLMDVGKVEIL